MTHPNILILMVDQLTGTLFPDGPAEWLHTPNLDRLAARSARFSLAISRSPRLTLIALHTLLNETTIAEHSFLPNSSEISPSRNGTWGFTERVVGDR